MVTALNDKDGEESVLDLPASEEAGGDCRINVTPGHVACEELFLHIFIS